MKDIEIIENKSTRERLISNIGVLDKVKDLLLLGDSEYATTQQVADYYEVDISVIQKLVSRNKVELESNGLKLNTKNEIQNLIGQDVKLEIVIPNRGMKLFPKRAILNVGMLLRDSQVAQEVRSRLLDIEYESNNAVQENGQTVKENITQEIDREKELLFKMGECIANGDFQSYLECQCQYNQMKNERIADLEETIDDITTHSLTITESKQVINRFVRLIACREYNGMFGQAWSELYSKVNYKLKINIKAREKKKNQSLLDTLTQEEMFQVEEIVRIWANETGIDVAKELRIGA